MHLAMNCGRWRSLSWLLLVSCSLVSITQRVLANPTGGVVTAGSASISSASKTMTVTQGTNKLAIDWSTFNIASGETLNFVQPGSSSIALNRVMGNNPSSIYGSLNANGSVFLVNPSGVLFGKASSVNVGSLVASTLNITDTDFLNGSYTFHGSGGLVLNQGSITTADGGYVALLGSQANNDGVIVANAGTVSLAGGNAVTLDFGGDGFLQVAVSQAALAASVANSGVISANGGKVYLTAEAADALAGTVVNNSGAIEAESLDTAGGTITLSGGSNGTVVNSGKLDVSGTSGGSVSVTGENISVPSGSVIDASATASGDGGSVQIVAADDTSFAGSILANGGPSGGDGGVVEVSGKQTLAYNGAVNTLAPAGSIGSLLLDPGDYTVDSSNVGALETTLGTTNTTISSTTNGSGTGLGDIDIDAPVTWSAATTLTLSADNNININSPITATAGGLTLNANDSSTGVGAITASAAVNVGSFTLTNGNWSQLSSTLPAFSATDFTLNGGTFVRALGGDGSSGNPYQLTDIYGVQGAGTLLSDNFILNNDIDASGTANWNGGAGFIPIGPDSGPGFTGSFSGLSNSVQDLIVNSPLDKVGMFAVNSGTVTDLTLLNDSIAALSGGSVGAIAGLNEGVISNSSANGSVTVQLYIGPATVGGLVGNNAGTVYNCYSSGSIVDNAECTGCANGGLIGTDSGSLLSDYSSASIIDRAFGLDYVGGLVGWLKVTGSISNCYAISNVTDMTGGYDSIGGFVGENDGFISNAYSTGRVTPSNADNCGGLIGVDTGATENCFWDTATSGQSVGAGDEEEFNHQYTGLSDTTIGGAFDQTSYSGFSFANDWYMLDGITRPFLQSEYSTNITNAHQLQLMVMQPAASYTLSNSFSAQETTQQAGMWRTSADPGFYGDYGFAPIGEFPVFSGQLNGNGYVVSGLTISSSAQDIGLLGVSSGTVENLTLTNETVAACATGSETNSAIGGLVGSNLGSISDSNVSGTTTNSNGYYSSVGGFVGNNFGSIVDSSSSITVTESNTTGSGNIGGLVGENESAGSISGCDGTGNVTDNGTFTSNSAGGLVGLNLGTVLNSYAACAVSETTPSGSSNLGGLIGDNGLLSSLSSPASIGGSHFLGVVTELEGNADLGGLVGYNIGSISNSYALGGVHDGSTHIEGGLVGYNDDGGSVSGSFAGNSISYTASLGGEIGGLVAINNGSVTDSHSIGSVVDNGGNEPVLGGLIGYNSGVVSSSYSNEPITVLSGGGVEAGGIAGYNDDSVTTCYSTGLVTESAGANDELGGIVGFNDGRGTVSGDYSYCNILDHGVGGNSNLGGLVGNNLGSISNSYATGTVTDNTTGTFGNSTMDELGGLVGVNDGLYYGSEGTVLTSYATGAIASTNSHQDDQGGLIGQNAGLVTSSYWDTTTGLNSGFGDGTGGVLTNSNGLTDSAMKLQTSFDSDWNFDSVWTSYNTHDYPLLTSFLTPLTVTLGGAPTTYDGFAQGPSVSYSVTPNSNLLGTMSYTPESGGNVITSLVNAGTYVPSGDGLYSNQKGYAISYAGTPFVIDPLALTYSTASATSTYGTLAVLGEVSLNGLVSGDIDSVSGIEDLLLSSAPVTLAANTAAGLYTEGISSLSGSAAGNYILATTGNTEGLLRINPKPITYSVSNISSVYGTLADEGTVSLNGVIPGDTSNVTGLRYILGPNGPVMLSPSTAAGLYSEGISSLAGSASSNYSLELAGNSNGTLTIGQKTVTFTVANAGSVYGTQAIPGQITLDGILGADTGNVSAASVISNGAGIIALSAETSAGLYSETASALTGAAAANYKLSPSGNTDGELSVAQAPLTVTSLSFTRAKGRPNPTFTSTVSGLTAGDTVATLGTINYNTAASVSSPVGTYSIIPFGISDNNYAITYADGILTVSQNSYSSTATPTYFDAVATLQQKNPSTTSWSTYWPLTINP